jgi:hypothetical protein
MMNHRMPILIFLNEIAAMKIKLGSVYSSIARMFRAKTILLVCLLAGFEFVFLLFVSGGHWQPWPASTDYFDQQAVAFLHGQTDLPTSPDPRLASLPNPYSPTARAGLDVLGDVSYFNGRYYLYWGPVPALVITLIHSTALALWNGIQNWHHPGRLIALLDMLAHMPIGDNVVCFFSASGISLLLSCIAVSLRNRFFSKLSTPWFIGTVAFAVLGLPLAWILNRPMMYEAAITSGQMFLLGGIALGLPTLFDSSGTKLRLLLASTCLAFAVGSRLSLAIAVVIVAGFFALALIRRSGSRKETTLRLACLLGPLMVGTAFLGYFNFIRFGNPFESGFRYQLGALDYTLPSSPTYQASYIIFNFYNYFLRPFSLRPLFPYLIPGGDNPTLYPFPLARPPIYYVEPTIGIAIVAPIIFCMAGLVFVLRRNSPLGNPSADSGRSHLPPLSSFRVVWFFLLSVSIGAFIPLAAYWYCTERFVLDFLPSLMLCVVCVVWILRQSLQHFPHLNRLFVLAVLLLGIWTIGSNLLLAITGYGSHF